MKIPAAWFLREVLKIDPYPWQIEALKAISRGKNAMGGKFVALVAPNGSGKTSNCIAPAILYFLTMFPKGQVAVTSASWTQIEKQLMPSLHRFIDNPHFAGWTFNKTEIKTPQGGFAYGFSTDNAGRAEGWHPKISADVDPVLYILDEAKTIPDAILTSVFRCTLYHAFLTSSPGADSGTFYNCFHKNAANYYKIRVKYEDCPHIERVDPGKAERVRREYGEDSATYRSSILGEFTDLEGASVISRKSLNELMANPPPFMDTGDICAGWDFAAGGDENVFALGTGNRITIHDAWRNPDTVQTRGRFRAAAKALNLSADRTWGDGDGLGLPLIDDFRNEGFPIHSYRGGFPADQPQAFVNLRAQAWRALARAIEEKEIILDIDEDTIEQLIAPRLEMDATGRLKIESKEDMAKRGVHSPDRADAIVMCYHAMNQLAVARAMGQLMHQRSSPKIKPKPRRRY